MTDSPGPPVRKAENESQLGSLTQLPKMKKYAIFETLNEGHYEPYHQVSCYPITVDAENDMVRHYLIISIVLNYLLY